MMGRSGLLEWGVYWEPPSRSIFRLKLAKFQRYVRIDAAARRKNNRAKYERRREELERNLADVKPLPPVDNLNHIPMYPAGVMRYIHSNPKVSEIQPAKDTEEKGVEERKLGDLVEEQKEEKIEEIPKVLEKSDSFKQSETQSNRKKSAKRKKNRKKAIAKDRPTENNQARKPEVDGRNEMLLVTSTLINHL